MNALKDIRVLSVIGIATLGLAFEGLRQLQFLPKNNPSLEVGKAGDLYSMHKDSTLPQHHARAARVEPTRGDIARAQVPTTGGVMFDLKKAITEYQKEHGIETAEAKTKDLKDKKKKKVEYEYVYDAKTGQWIKRKKLTAAQKQLLAKQRAERAKKANEQKDKNQNPFNSTTGDYNLNRYAVNATGNVQNQNVTPVEEDDKFMSFEEWAARLLQFPNPSEVQRFVEAYRSQKVTSDIFNRILDAMLEDPRVDMNEQGLTLAGLVPSLHSFKSLVAYLDTPSIAQSSRQIAEKKLDQYATLPHLSVLEKVMKQASEPQLIKVAIAKLNNAMDRYLTSPSAQGTNYASNFTRFVNVLQDLISFQDSTVVTQAQTTLQQLQASLSKGNNNVAAIDTQL